MADGDGSCGGAADVVDVGSATFEFSVIVVVVVVVIVEVEVEVDNGADTTADGSTLVATLGSMLVVDADPGEPGELEAAEAAAAAAATSA